MGVCSVLVSMMLCASHARSPSLSMSTPVAQRDASEASLPAGYVSLEDNVERIMSNVRGKSSEIGENACAM